MRAPILVQQWMSVAMLAAGIAACTANDNEDDTAGGAVTCDRDPPLTYDNFGKGYMELHCVGCHSELYPSYLRSNAPVGVDFNTYYQVLFWAERIEARGVGAKRDMPPAGGPTDDEVDVLVEWLECQVYPDRQRLIDTGKL